MIDDRTKEEEEFHDLKYSQDIGNKSILHSIERSIYSSNRSTYEYFYNLISENVQNKDVLECGCGVDEYSQRLARKCNRYVAFDLSEEAIKFQKSKSSQLDINAEYRIMNIENLNFSDKSFDIIFGQSILHHSDLTKTYGELARLLKTNGHAFFLEPIEYNPIVFIYRKLTPSIRTKTEHPITLEDIELAKKYFKKVDIQYFNFFSYLILLPYLSSENMTKLINHLDKRFLNSIPFPILFATIMIIKLSN